MFVSAYPTDRYFLPPTETFLRSLKKKIINLSRLGTNLDGYERTSGILILTSKFLRQHRCHGNKMAAPSSVDFSTLLAIKIEKCGHLNEELSVIKTVIHKSTVYEVFAICGSTK